MFNIYFVVYELQVYTVTSWFFWINYANVYAKKSTWIVSDFLNKYKLKSTNCVFVNHTTFKFYSYTQVNICVRLFVYFHFKNI